MPRTPRLSRILVYTLLIAASLLFLAPFVWLLSSSLKPIEQAMSLPPTLLPRAHYATIDASRTEVTLDFTLREPGLIADLPGESGSVRRVFYGAEELRTLAAKPANARPVSAGWIHITARRDASSPAGEAPAWDIVPPERIESHIRFRWENYSQALAALGGNTRDAAAGVPQRGPGFLAYALNTVIVCVLGVIGTVLSNAIVAYGFARLRWRGRDAFFALTLASMMVPFPVLMVPLYGLFKNFGWIGTLLPLWVPAWFGSAFNIFLMRQFFRRLPEELSEAARLDGCSEWRIFWHIVLPLSKPVLATAALLHFLYAWNDFLGPLLYLTRKETFTLSLALQNYQSQQGGIQWHYMMAASTVTLLPVVVLFFFAQRTFIQGIATTGSKG